MQAAFGTVSGALEFTRLPLLSLDASFALGLGLTLKQASAITATLLASPPGTGSCPPGDSSTS